MFKNYYFFIFTAIICLLIAVFCPFEDEKLIVNSEHKQQIWRLVTSHIVHKDASHLIGNLLAFVLLIYLFPLSWQKQVRVFIVAMVLIDAYLLIFSISKYLGLSGLIYAIPGVKFFELLKQKKIIPALIILSTLILYVFVISPQTYEIQANNWQPLKAAHVLGFLAGITLAKRLKRIENSQTAISK